MKKKISVSMDEKTIEVVESKVDGDIFRNKSHLIEYAVNRFLKGGKNGF
jgi:Arc/MetJ-type ribon-helix-helix transcriptional regulator|tara:strand:+ start:12583 stop:12729 length:147 start_codon:yes stop_codon:yes gene_type:complete